MCSSDLSVVSLNSTLQTIGWIAPPTNMQGLVALPNGIMAGFSNNELCFCEPFYPHAWPIKYRLTTESPIVALGVIHTSLVVTTTGFPYLVTGNNPTSMSMDKIELNYPCISKRGLISFDGKVIYPTNTGLVSVSASGTDLITDSYYSRDEWLTINIKTLVGLEYDGRYFSSYSITTGGGAGFIFDPRQELGKLITTNFLVTGGMYDVEFGKLYLIIDNLIKEWDADASGSSLYQFNSKEFLTPRPLNFGAAQVDLYFSTTPADQITLAAANATNIANNAALISSGMFGAINDYEVDGLTVNGSNLLDIKNITPEQLIFYLYANGVLKFQRNILDRKTFNLPSGYKSDVWEYRLSGNTKVRSVLIAETREELAQL